MSLDPDFLIDTISALDRQISDIPLWSPFKDPGKVYPQEIAYHHQADELFYGGQAGGGKTDLIVGCALTHGERSIIYRREGPQFYAIEDRIIELAPEPRGKYNSSKRVLDLDNRLRTVRLASVQYDKSWKKYAGQGYDHILWDEVTHFTELMYRTLGGWNRTTNKTQRCRIIATGNPPTDYEGEWVIRYWGPWLDPTNELYGKVAEGELVYYITVDSTDEIVEGPGVYLRDQQEYTARSRTFIAAAVDDNPLLMATGYKAQLQSLPEPLRSQMLHGDFSAGRKDDEYQIIPTEWIRLAQARWKEPTGQPDSAAVDVARGGKDQTVICLKYGTTFKTHEIAGSKTPDGQSIATAVNQLIGGDSIPIAVDAVGVGSSAVDYLREYYPSVMAIQSAAKSSYRAGEGLLRFGNLRAEMWWKLREALDPEKGEDLALPPKSTVLADLSAPRYKMTARGIMVEDKAAITKRLGRSPDTGESIVYCYHLAVAGTIDLGSWG